MKTGPPPRRARFPHFCHVRSRMGGKTISESGWQKPAALRRRRWFRPAVGGVGGFVLQRLREIEKTAARTFTELVVSADQFQRFLLAEHVSGDQVAIVRRSARSGRLRRLLQAFEEVVNRHVECDGQFVQTRRGHAVRAALVLLDLLKADADGLSQLLLGEAEEAATAAEPLADMEIDGVSHGCAPLFAAVPPWAGLFSKGVVHRSCRPFGAQ